MTTVLEEMVEGGQLTAQEKSGMLEQLGSKVEMADKEIVKVPPLLPHVLPDDLMMCNLLPLLIAKLT